MAKTLTIEVPDDLAASAEQEGLWNSAKIADLMTAEIRRLAWQRLRSLMDKAQSCNDPPLSEEDVQEIVDEVRAEGRANRANCS